jgi:hypothetical protein
LEEYKHKNNKKSSCFLSYLWDVTLEVVSKPSIRFNIESLGPTQKLGLRGDFETASNKFK